jgi:outer membrane protein assembly factor BamB
MRVIDWLVIVLLLLIFSALTAYQYLRQDLDRENHEKLRELSSRAFPEQPAGQFDWPQWRGVHRDGVSTETGLLTVWPSQGPPLLWEKSLGEGFASVCIVKGCLFTTAQQEGKESVLCLEAASGAAIWQFSYPCNYKNGFGNGPRSTPAVDGEYIYTVGAKGMMHCLKAFGADAGKIIWHTDLMRDFAAPLPQWGFAFSPLVDGNLVFIQPGGPEENSLAALNKQTGEIVWKKYDDPAGYSSPIAATFQTQKQILFFTGARLIGVQPETGRLLWEYAWPTSFHCNIATPIIVGDYVFISSGYDHGCALLKIEKQGTEWEAVEVYTHRRMRNHFATCVRHKDFIYGFDDGNLKCINLRTGKEQWRERGFDKGSVLLVKDHLIVYGENGIAALAEATPAEYREKSRFQFSQERPCWSVPVVANGRLYLRDPKKLTCYDVKETH